MVYLFIAIPLFFTAIASVYAYREWKGLRHLRQEHQARRASLTRDRVRICSYTAALNSWYTYAADIMASHGSLTALQEMEALRRAYDVFESMVSVDDIATGLGLDADSARDLVRDALAEQYRIVVAKLHTVTHAVAA